MKGDGALFGWSLEARDSCCKSGRLNRGVQGPETESSRALQTCSNAACVHPLHEKTHMVSTHAKDQETRSKRALPMGHGLSWLTVLGGKFPSTERTAGKEVYIQPLSTALKLTPLYLLTVHQVHTPTTPI
jgi:hypothetical protein